MNDKESVPAHCSPPTKRWETPDIVVQLRAIRDESLAARHISGAPVKLPSRKVLADVVNGIGAAIFPNRLGRQDLDADAVDYFVGHTLECALKDLKDQIRLELIFGERYSPVPVDVQDKAVVIYAGATILGRITIGARSVIGGNVWLTRSVPPDSNITQAKHQNEVFNSGAGI